MTGYTEHPAGSSTPQSDAGGLLAAMLGRSIVTDDDGNSRYVSPSTLTPTSREQPEPEPSLDPGRYSQADLMRIMAGREPVGDPDAEAEQRRQRAAAGYRRDSARNPSHDLRREPMSQARLLRIMTGRE